MGTDSEAKYLGRLLGDLTLGIRRWKTVLSSVTTHHYLETGVLFAFEYFNASGHDIRCSATIRNHQKGAAFHCNEKNAFLSKKQCTNRTAKKMGILMHHN